MVWSWAILLLCTVAPLTRASCMHGRLKTEMTAFGSEVKYCQYKEMQLLPDSKFIDKISCQTVTCSESGFSICGYGINAGVFAPPPGCRLVQDGCEPKFVPLRGPPVNCYGQ